MKRSATERLAGGFSLVEFLIGSVVLSIFLGTLVLSSSRMLGMGVASDVRAQAEELGATTLQAILADLRISGFVDEFPYLFVDGDAQPPFDAHDHPPAQKQAVAGEPDFGPNREIVFLRPADQDRDGVPDFDAAGDLVWGPVELSYVVVSGPDGINALQRRVNGQTGRTVALHVERIAFDDIVTSGFELPLGVIRVRVWFRLPDGNGGTFRHAAEATVRLRN